MSKSRSMLLTALTLSVVLLAVGCPSVKEGKLTGWVTEPDGTPLAFVSVAAGDKTVHTDGSGLFTFDAVRAGKSVRVTFALEGYAGSVQLVRIDANANATLNATLKRLAEGSALSNAAAGGSASTNGDSIAFPAGALNTGNSKAVQAVVHVTPVNFAYALDINCAPGEMRVTMSGGANGLLNAYAMANFAVLVDDEAITLKPGATATVRFKLATGSGLHAGDTVPLWYFDASTGAWVQQGTGTVVAGAGGALYVEGSVSHLGWWCCAVVQANLFTIKGHVYDAAAQPAAGAIVVARGLNYHGVAHVLSGSDGSYSVSVLPNAQVRLSLVLPGAYYVADALDITAGAAGLTLENQDLAPDFKSAIQGHVTEEDGTTPIANTRVYSSAGGAATTASDGSFCMLAPASTPVAVYVLGRPPMYVQTPATATCEDGKAADVTISVYYPKNGDRLGFIFSTLRTTDIPILGPQRSLASTALFYSGFKGDQFAPYDPATPLDTCHVYTAAPRAPFDLSIYFGLLTQSLALNLAFDLDFGVSETFGLDDGQVPDITKIGALDAGSPASMTNQTKTIAMKRPLDYYYGFEGDGSLQDLGYAALEAWMGGFYFQEGLASSGFNNGETLSFTWPGGLDIGAFTAQGVIPGRLTVTAPSDLSNAFSANALQNGLPVAWSTQGQGSYVSLVLETIVIDNIFSPVRVGALVCRAADDGSYTIPASALAQMPQITGNTGTQINYLFAKRHTVAQATAPLTRGNGNGYVVVTIGTEPVIRWSVDSHIGIK